MKLPRVVSSLLLLILGLLTVGGILVLVLNMWVGEVGNDTFAGGGILVFVLNMWVGEVGNNTFAGGGILVLVLDMLVGEVESDTDANKCNSCYHMWEQCQFSKLISIIFLLFLSAREIFHEERRDWSWWENIRHYIYSMGNSWYNSYQPTAYQQQG